MNKHLSKKVFVGLSGGVDSAVAAALLLQQGYEVEGVFMKNWSGDDFGVQADCPWEEDQKSAELVARHLGIPFRSFNFEKEYRARVVDYFFGEYAKGRTPNPDVICNKEIKFAAFLDKALGEGADFIATGHYVRREPTQPGSEDVVELLRGVDANKDQSYFLYTLNQEQLAKSLFPVGHLTKPEVRKLAFDLGLPNAGRPDSQGICFIGEIDVQQFLRQHISTKPGDIVDVDTKQVVGKHDGVYYYTIGQREGLGIGGQETPYFVVGKEVELNQLFVAHGHDHPALNKRVVVLEGLHQINPDNASWADNSALTASVRYRQAAQPGKLDVEKLTFEFDQPQRAIAIGQSLVLYAGDACLGGGVIREAL